MLLDFLLMQYLLIQVHLGEGIMCSKYAHQVLSTVKEHSDWAITLLTEVYGNKAQKCDIKNFGIQTLSSSNSFVNVAKCEIRFCIMLNSVIHVFDTYLV